MATYTTRNRVQALAAKLPTFSSTTTVTDTEVDDMIEDVEAELDVALATHGYTTPVTEPAALVRWLEKVAAEGAVATVLKAWYQDQAGPNSDGAWAVYERRYQDALGLIRDNRLPASTDTSGGQKIQSFQTLYPDGIDPGDLGTASDPVFSRETQW